MGHLQGKKKTRATKRTKTEHIWADNHIQPKTILWLWIELTSFFPALRDSTWASSPIPAIGPVSILLFLFLSQLLSYSSHQPRLHSQPPPWRGGGIFHHASHACAVGSRPPPLKNENFTPPGWPVKRGLQIDTENDITLKHIFFLLNRYRKDTTNNI